MCYHGSDQHSLITAKGSGLVWVMCFLDSGTFCYLCTLICLFCVHAIDLFPSRCHSRLMLLLFLQFSRKFFLWKWKGILWLQSIWWNYYYILKNNMLNWRTHSGGWGFATNYFVCASSKKPNILKKYIIIQNLKRIQNLKEIGIKNIYAIRSRLLQWLGFCAFWNDLLSGILSQVFKGFSPQLITWRKNKHLAGF